MPTELEGLTSWYGCHQTTVSRAQPCFVDISMTSQHAWSVKVPRPQLSTNSPNTHALDPLREWLWYRIIIAGCGLPKRSFGISIRLDEPIGQMTLPQESSCGTSDQLLLPIRHGRRDQMTSSEDLTSWRNMEMDFDAHLAVLMKVGCNGERRTGNVRKWGTL